MFWFQIKTENGYIKVNYSEQEILSIDFTGKIQKKDKYYKIYPELEKDLEKYFSGQKVNFNKYKISYGSLTYFQQKVLENTRHIPYGNTKFYSQLANEIGNPKACRAIGNALNKNPIPIIIPCHRVIQKSGKIGGFSAGEKWKKALLLLENNEYNTMNACEE